MDKEIRRKDRGVTDLNQIIEILDKAKILHLGLLDHGFPYIVPLHYVYEFHRGSDKITFYMHGAKAGRKIDLINSNSNAGIELETDIELDSGGDVPCRYGSFYASFIGTGRACIVEDDEEKEHALNLLMMNQTGKRFEFDERMLSSVAVIKVEVSGYTAKARRRMM